MNRETTTAAPNVNGARLAKLNSPWFIWPAAGVLAMLLYFGLHYLNFALTNETTDDAFIAANVVSVAPRVAGQVSAVHVLDNETVHSNELLIEIDPSNYATTASQKQATVAEAEANYKVVVAGLNLMNEKVTTAGATADQSKADAEAANATDELAKADFQRMETLREANTISAQEFDAAQAAVRKADADLIAARQKAVADNSKISEAKAQLAATEAAVEGHDVCLISIEHQLDSPSGSYEIGRLKKKGVEHLERTVIKRVLGEGKVQSVETIKVNAEIKAGVILKLEQIPGTEQIIEKVDTIIVGIGQVPTPPFNKEYKDIKTLRWGGIEVNDRYLSSKVKVFATGDITTGITKVGRAYQTGLKTAHWVDRYLRG